MNFYPYVLHLLLEGPIEQHASMVTTEISQVPFSGVLALLKAAKSVGGGRGPGLRDE